MDHGVAALHRGGERRAVGEVALAQLGAELGERLRPSPGCGPGDDLVAALAQLADDVTADEPGSPGDEDLHRASLSSGGQMTIALKALLSARSLVRAMLERWERSPLIAAELGVRDRQREPGGRAGGRRRPARRLRRGRGGRRGGVSRRRSRRCTAEGVDRPRLPQRRDDREVARLVRPREALPARAPGRTGRTSGSPTSRSRGCADPRATRSRRGSSPRASTACSSTTST